MGNLTDAAKNSFNKFGGKTHVPEWYRFTYLIGFTIIFFAIIFSLINEDSDIKEELNLNNKLINTNSTKLDNNSIINNIENDNNNLIDNSNIDKIKIIDTNDIYTYIPKEAFYVAKLSAEALFTGNWSDVPIYGEIPDSTIKENKIKILDSVLLSYEENNEINIIFNYKRDKKNSKIRVTVYYIDNRWVFAL